MALRPPTELAAQTSALLVHLRAQRAARYRTTGSSRDVVRGWDVDDLNLVHLTGTLGSEPLLCDVGDHPTATLTLASERRWRSAVGTVQIETTWFNLTAWEELAEHCGRLFHQGDRVYVEGYLHLWNETRPPHSYACHSIVLDRIILLAAAKAADRHGQRTS